MAPPGGDSLCVLLPVPNLRAGSTGREAKLRDALRRRSRASFGLHGLRASIVVEHRMTPEDFRTGSAPWRATRSRSSRRCTSPPAFRPPNRDRRLAGLYHVGGGTHPGAGIPGVLLGAEDHGGPASRATKPVGAAPTGALAAAAA